MVVESQLRDLISMDPSTILPPDVLDLSPRGKKALLEDISSRWEAGDRNMLPLLPAAAALSMQPKWLKLARDAFAQYCAPGFLQVDRLDAFIEAAESTGLPKE